VLNTDEPFDGEARSGVVVSLDLQKAMLSMQVRALAAPSPPEAPPTRPPSLFACARVAVGNLIADGCIGTGHVPGRGRQRGGLRRHEGQRRVPLVQDTGAGATGRGCFQPGLRGRAVRVQRAAWRLVKRSEEAEQCVRVCSLSLPPGCAARAVDAEAACGVTPGAASSSTCTTRSRCTDWWRRIGGRREPPPC
jgi:hypothetical protein